MKNSESSHRPSTAATSAGLAKYRSLQVSEAPAESSGKRNLPDGWYFNESKQNEFWKDLEQYDPGIRSTQTKEEEVKSTFSDIGSSANRVQAILAEFDQLDQDVIMELMQIVDQSSSEGTDYDQFSLINEAKSNVVINIEELREYADNQTVLLDSIKAWLLATQEAIRFKDSDQSILREKLPDVDYVYESLAGLLQEYSERSERAAFLHKDVIEFWQRQVTQMKRGIYARDEEIRKLQETIQAAQAARQRKTAKRANAQNTDQEKEKAALMQQVEKQMRIVQEQKAQIEKLKGSLQNSESERAMMGTTQTASSSVEMEKLLLAKEQIRINMEAETKIVSLNEQVEMLNKQLEQTKEEFATEKYKNNALQMKIEDRDRSIKEMDIMLQKYLQQLTLERSKPAEVKKVEPTNMVDQEEHAMEMLKLKEQMKGMSAQHSYDLMHLKDTLEKKYRREREKLLAAMETPDDQNLLKAIVSEYDKKFLDQEEAFKLSLNRSNNTWTAKLALLTRQYESRIKSMLGSHEVEILSVKESLQYEVKKAELDLQEKHDMELLESNKKKEIELKELQDKYEANLNKLFYTEKHVDLLKQLVKKYDPNSNLLKKSDSFDVTDLITEVPPSKTEGEEESPEDKYARMFVNYKHEIDEQHQWELEKLREFYERKIKEQCAHQQMEIRKMLLDMQDAAKFVDDEPSDERKEKLADIMSSVFVKLNEHAEAGLPDDTPVIDADEAAARTKLLSERVSALTEDIGRTKNELRSVKAENARNKSMESEIQRLKEKIIYMESLQSGDTKTAMEHLEKMEALYKNQLIFKDEEIGELREEIARLKVDMVKPDLVPSEKTVIFSYFVAQPTIPSFSPSPVEVPTQLVPEDEDYEYDDFEEEDENAKRTSSVRSSSRSIKQESARSDTPATPATPEPQEKPKKKVISAAGSLKSGINMKSPKMTTETIPRLEKIEPAEDDSSQRASADASTPGSSVRAQKGEKRKSMSKRKSSLKSIQRLAEMQTQKAPPKEQEKKQEEIKPKSEYREVIRRKRPRYNIETQISLQEPIVEAALKSIIEQLVYRKCDSFTISERGMIFNDSKSAPKKAPITAIRNPKPAGFKAKLFISNVSGIDRNDNFIELTPVTMIPEEPEEEDVIEEKPVVSERSIEPDVTPVVQSPPKKRRLRRARAVLASVEPVPQNHIVIAPDEEQMALIRELQEQIKAVSEQTNDGSSGGNKDFLDSVKSMAYDRIVKLLSLRNAKIEELMNRPPEVVYQPTIVSVPTTNSPDAWDTRTIPHKRSPYNMKTDKSIPPGPRLVPETLQLDSLSEAQSENTTARSEHRTARTARLELTAREKLWTPRIQREPIQFILPPEEEIPDNQLMEDPFTAAIQSLASNMRFMLQMKDNQREIIEKLESDYHGYEVYLRASEQINDNDITFIGNLEDVKRNMDKLATSYDMFNDMQMTLLQIVRQSRKRAQNLVTDFNEMKMLHSNERLRSQTSLLKGIKAHESKTVIMNQIASALQVVDQLGVAMLANEHNEYDTLMAKLEELRACDEMNISEQVIDELLIDTQNFVTGLTSRHNDDIRQNQMMSANSISELKKTKTALKRAKEMCKNLEIELERERETKQHDEDKIMLLTDHLREEKESNEKTASLYQSQISSLRELFNQIAENSNGENPTTPLELTNAIKKGVMNLQLLLDTQMNQVHAFKEKCFDMEQTIIDRDKLIAQLKNQIEDLEIAHEELDAKMKKRTKESLFQEADEATWNQISGAEKELSEAQKVQLESVSGENKKLLDRINQLEVDLSKKMTTLRKLTDEVDEWKLRSAMGQMDKAEMYSRETQTTFRAVVKQSIINKTANEIIRHNTQRSARIQQQEETSREEEDTFRPPTPTLVIEEEEESKEAPDSAKSTQREPIESFVPHGSTPPLSKDNSSTNVLPDDELVELKDDDVEWVEEDMNLDDTYTDSLAETSREKRTDILSEFQNDTYQGVKTDPLQWRKKKQSLASILNDASSKKKSKEKKPLLPKHAIVPPQTTETDQLAIGFGNRPPSRSIHSTSGKRPVQPVVLLGPKPPKAAPVVPVIHSTNLQILSAPPQKQQQQSSRQEPLPKVIQEELYPESSRAGESIRITAVHFEDGPPKLEKSIRISKIESVASRGDILHTGGSVTHRPTSGPNMDEIKKIISRLNKKVKELQEMNDEKDQTIIDLKRKLSEVSTALNRSKIECIREKDNRNRAVLRFDNINARLQAAMVELGDRQEEVSKLKRDIIRMKYASAPAASQLRRMSHAQKEQTRLAKEEKISKVLLQKTKAIAGKTDDESVKDYLETIMEHAQQTVLRNEARRKYWKKVEHDQMMAVLGSLSLLARDLPEIPGMNAKKRKSPFFSVVRQKPHVSFESETDNARLVVSPREKVPSYSETINLIDQVEPPLSHEEKLAIIKRQLSPELDTRLNEAYKAKEQEPIDTAIITNC